MEGIEINNVYQLLFALIVFFITGGGAKLLFESIQRRKFRKELNKSIEGIDEKQNEEIVWIKEKIENLGNTSSVIEKKLSNLVENQSASDNNLEELLSISKIDKSKKKVKNAINKFITLFIEKEIIKDKSYEIILTSIEILASNIFDDMIDEGLEVVDVERLSTKIDSYYEMIWNNSSHCIDDKLKRYLKENAVSQERNNFISNFEISQMTYKNGQLQEHTSKKFIKMVENMIVKSKYFLDNYKNK